MAVKHIHQGKMFYVSCTINSSWIQGQSMANHCGYHTALLSVPQASHSSQDVLVAFPSAKLGASFKGKRSSVLKCWLHFVYLLDFWFFLNTSARNSFALLFPAHLWLSVIAWCIFSTFLLLAKYSNREGGTGLGW